MGDEKILVEVDPRGRVSQARLGVAPGRYLGDVEPDGSVVLRPAAVVTQAQRRLWERADILSAVQALEDRPAVASKRGRPQRTASA